MKIQSKLLGHDVESVLVVTGSKRTYCLDVFVSGRRLKVIAEYWLNDNASEGRTIFKV